MDHRAVDDAERINAGRHEALRYVGGKISPEMHAPKLIWLARRKPETIANAGHFFDLTDFLSFRATGSLARSACPATCKFGYLAHEKRWPDGFFDSASASGFSRTTITPASAPRSRRRERRLAMD